MKKITILAMLLLLTAASYAQQTEPSKNWKDSDLYKKSQGQKVLGWTLTTLGTAGLVITLGAQMSQPSEFHFSIYGASSSTPPPSEPPKSYTVEYALSGAALVTGIYLIVKGSINKGKARKAFVFVDVENAKVQSGIAFKSQAFPVVGLKVRL